MNSERSKLPAVLLVVGALVAAAVWAVVFATSAEPNASQGTQSQPSIETDDDPVALFFGDSYFNGSDYTAPEESMALLAGDRLGMVSYLTGAGGTGFTTGNAEGVPAYAAQVQRGAWEGYRDPDLLVIEGGLNDRDNADEVTGGAVTVLGQAQAMFPHARVVLVGPVDTDGDMADTAPVVAALDAAADKARVRFVDASAWLVGRYELIGEDGTHPTPAGARYLAGRLATALS